MATQIPARATSNSSSLGPGLSDLRTQELLDAVMSTMPDGLFTVDPRGRITSWNVAMEEITGYSAAEALGQSCAFLEGDACATGCEHRDGPGCAPFTAAEVRRRRCTIRHRDGSRVEVLKNARALRAPDGSVLGAVETVTDISLQVSLEAEVARLRYRTPRTTGFAGLIGREPPMQRLFDLLELAAQSASSVLVEGETGTGKELVAAAIHKASPRAHGPLVRVSCAALSEGLLESELFGHVRGAFTGAVSSREGRFEAASGGTLVLDEIGDVSLNVQTKLLRVLQEQEVERVGSNHSVHIDIRVVASTNRDLLALCDEGRFRRDLYYRLAVIPVRVPPLRERRGDIPLLVEHFVARLNQAQGRQVKGLTPGAMARLVGSPWPGNVRELEHAVEYAFVVTRGDVIDEGALPAALIEAPEARGARDPAMVLGPRASTEAQGRPQAAEILAALQVEGGHRAATARRLGVSRMTLWKWMRDLELEWPPAAADGPSQPGLSGRR